MFQEEEIEHLNPEYDDALVVSFRIANACFKEF